MDLIKKEVMGLVKMKGGLEAELPRNVSFDAASKSSSTESKSAMVGFEDELLQLKERLVGGDSSRQIIPIVGMGGIGKTTLARNVFADHLIKEHFDICLWAAISQDCNIEQTLREILSQAKMNSIVEGLGEELHKYLWDVRYLVVLDDLWSLEVWDKMRFFFPDCGKRSRVIVTTRMSNLASHLSSSDNSLRMSFLNEEDSWTLFSKTVFGSEGSVVPELREIGEKIVGKCKGLPLSIVVIGGLLAKSELTQGYWEYVEKNLHSTVNLENEEYCLRVLKLSYNHLPAYLKPCFLYMGVFDEDREIEVSTVIRLWVSEGFVKRRKKRQNLKTVAREYFQELVDRNLVLALADDEVEPRVYFNLMDRELGSVGDNIKWCKMHDLVRDLSLREARKQSFYHVHRYNSGEIALSSSKPHRCIVIPRHNVVSILPIMPNTRSCICHDDDVREFPDSRLLRTLHTTYRGSGATFHDYAQKEVFELVNSRLLAIAVKKDRKKSKVLHSSVSRLWSLHTLIVYSGRDLEGPVEFWKMHQLEHVEFTCAYGRLRLQLPPNDDNNIVILENLHTLMGTLDFHFNEDVVGRIPNLTVFDTSYEEINWEVHSLSFLERLSKLESFRCSIKKESGENLERICFPHSLKQILLLDDYSVCSTLRHIELEDILLKIGGLPFVEELIIEGGFFGRREWEKLEGQFPRLKTLRLVRCGSMRKWTVSETAPYHFPLLQTIHLGGLEELEEIPSEIGDIAHLRTIRLNFCSKSAVLSAKEIVQEQENFHGEDELSFRVLVHDHDTTLASLATTNFRVEIFNR